MTAEGGELRVFLDGLAETKDMCKYINENSFGQSDIIETNCVQKTEYEIFEGIHEGGKGILSIDVEIFEFAPHFHLIGDTLEYEKILVEAIGSFFKDFVWVWQGDQQELSQ
ncbi:CBL-interacting serine/threonine-protein kinase 10 [Glycine max]|nr:CBL-interacting serine/threonine-protein kinase 10 [Glycine max]